MTCLTDMATTLKYVLQRADGQFYWKDKSVSSRWGYTEDFGKAYLFDSEKGAKTRVYTGGEGVRIRPVFVALADKEPIYVPSCWREEDIKRTPSMCSWATIDDDGEYRHGESYYDADGKEITKEEYEALVRRPTD